MIRSHETPRVLRPRRTAGLLLAGLALGAAATLVEAWAIAYLAPNTAPAGSPGWQGPGMYRGAIVGFATTDVGGVRRVTVNRWAGAQIVIPEGSTLALNQDRIPAWSLVGPLEGDWRRDTPEELEKVILIEAGYGWPWTTMVSRIIGDSMTPLEDRELQGIRFTPAPTRTGPIPALLPTRPAWRGFIASTLVLSLPVTGPVAAGVLVRTRRRRRGWCVGCGYDLRGLAGAACPECGAVTDV